MKRESFNYYSEEEYLLEETIIGEPESGKGNESTQTKTECPQEPTTQDEEFHKVMHIREAEETLNDEKVNVQQGIKDKGVIISEDTILKPEKKTIKIFPKNMKCSSSMKNFSSNGINMLRMAGMSEHDTITVLNRKPHKVKLLRGSTIGWFTEIHEIGEETEEALVLCTMEDKERVTSHDHKIDDEEFK
ncbi:hypothetical protein JTB14_037802 [Gonioctena quinquepunctata]|nr:hypothetical protein JTB14_037802 [Gonioctena quinquepunctata]